VSAGEHAHGAGPAAAGNGWTARLGPPLLAFLLFQAAFVLIAVLCDQRPFDPDSYARRDSTKYLKIAKFGYFERAGDPQAGTAGWFPAYALAMRAGAWLTGARPVTVGRAVSVACHLGLLVVLASFLPAGPFSRTLALLTAAFFPGAVYYGAVFPISMAALLAVAAIALCARGSFLAAGGAGALAAFTYPSGLVVAAPLALGVLMRRGMTTGARLAWLVALPALCLAGLGAVLAWQHHALGRWDAFFAYQRAFGNAASNPAAALAANFGRLWSDPYRPARLIGLQAVLTAALVVGALFVWWRRRAEVGTAGAMLVLHAAAMWAFPLALGANTSTYRQAALAVGLTPVLARLPALAQQCLLVLLVVLACGMGVLFFDDVLV
jgi:hypothetical protein